MVLICLLQLGCKTKPKEKHILLYEKSVDFESGDMVYKKKGGAHGGTFYGYCDKQNPFTPAFSYQLPDSIKNCFVRICFDLYAKVIKRRFGQSIVIAIQHKDSMIYWNTTNVNAFTLSKDKWVKVSDSVQFYHQYPFPPGTEIKVFGFNSYEKGELYVDDINIKVKKVTLVN